MNFEELQESWANQPSSISTLATDQHFSDRLISSTLNTIQLVQEEEEKQRKQSVAIRIMAIGITIYLCGLPFFIPNLKPVTYVGYGVILIVVYLTVWVLEQNRITFKNKNLTQPSVDFLREVIRQYRFRGTLRKTLGWIYGILLSIGIFLGTFQFASLMSVPAMIITYSTTFFWIVLIAVLGTVHAYKKYLLEVKPLLLELENELDQIENDQ